VPERIQLSYVAFPATNFQVLADERIAGMTNFAQQIDAMYQQRGANFYTDAANQPLSPEAAKEKIRQEIREELAMNEARRVAYDFASELERVPVNTNSPNPAETLENLAAAKGLQAMTTEPFTQFSGPAGLGLPDDFIRMSFRLSPQEPIVPEPVTGENGVYVISYKNRIQSQDQPFELVQAAATEEFKRREAQRLTREAGTALATTIQSGLASGKDFDSLVREAGHQSVDVSPFTRKERIVPGLPLQVDISPLANTAFNLAAGQASNFQPSRDGGYIAFVEKFVPAPDDEVQREVPQFVQDLRRRNASEAFNQWFVKEMQLAQLNLPGDGLDRMGMDN
jgi:hypothetical protein